ncbi:hypothetical protein ES704_02698 [subsurface metagenome]
MNRQERQTNEGVVRAMATQDIADKNCPLKLKICFHSLSRVTCSWWRNGRCNFPPGGYDKFGNEMPSKGKNHGTRRG